MFERIKELISGKKQEQTKIKVETNLSMVSEEAPKAGMIMPYLGSALRSSKKEAMAGLLFETMNRKNKKVGEKILITEFLEVLKELEKSGGLPTVYKTFSPMCWNAFWEMGDEGLLVIHQKEKDEEEGFVIVTVELDKLLDPNASTGEKNIILLNCELRKTQKQLEENLKKQENEQGEKAAKLIVAETDLKRKLKEIERKIKIETQTEEIMKKNVDPATPENQKENIRNQYRSNVASFTG